MYCNNLCYQHRLVAFDNLHFLSASNYSSSRPMVNSTYVFVYILLSLYVVLREFEFRSSKDCPFDSLLRHLYLIDFKKIEKLIFCHGKLINTTVHYINLIWVTKLQNLSQFGQRYS